MSSLSSHRYLRCVLCGKEVSEVDFDSETVMIHMLRQHGELLIAFAESFWRDVEADAKQYTSE